MNDLLDGLKALSGGADGQSAQTGPGVQYSAAALILKLEPLLKSGNAASLELIPAVHDIFALDRKAALLVKQIEDFDFSAAIETLGELRRRVLRKADHG